MWKKAPHSWALICIDQKELFYRNTTIADIWNWRQERNESGKFRFNASELMQTFDYLLRQKLNIMANLNNFSWNLCLCYLGSAFLISSSSSDTFSKCLIWKLIFPSTLNKPSTIKPELKAKDQG